MRFLFGLLLLILGFNFIHGQEMEAGMFIGIANYQGDLAENRVEVGETRLGFGVNLDYIIEPRFRVSGRVYNGYISGDDNNNRSLNNRGLSFNAQVREFSVVGVYMPFAKDRFRYGNRFQSFVTPKAFIGLGVTHAKAEVSSQMENDTRFPESGDQDVFLSIPVGVGLHYAFSPYTNMGVEAGWRTVLSDYLDGVSEYGNPDAGDWYFFTGINLSVNFAAANK